MEIAYIGHHRRSRLVSLPALRLRADAPRLGHAERLSALRRRRLRPRVTVQRRRLDRRSGPAQRSARRTDCGSGREDDASRPARGHADRPRARRARLGRARRAAGRGAASGSRSPASTSSTKTSGELADGGADARVDAHRTQPRGGRALRRPDRLAPPRADRAPARRRPGARRPQPQRRVRERRADRVAGAARTATRSSSGATG